MGFIPLYLQLGAGNPTVVTLHAGLEYGVSFYF
jgi:hypothetical protein